MNELTLMPVTYAPLKHAANLLFSIFLATWALTAAHSQERQPRIENVMTEADRALVVQALRKANSPLAKPYSQGAPLAWHLMPELEKALKAVGTPAAADLLSRIDAARPKPRAESEPFEARPHPKLTFEDGYARTWAENHGPTFIFNMKKSETDVVRRAFDKVAEEHEKDPHGWDDYLMGRRARILEEIDQGGFGLFVGGPGGWEDHAEMAFPFSLLQMILVGTAVSRDRYCRAEDQDVDDLQFLEAGVECYLRNTAAIKLFDRIAATRHVSPGGAVR